MASRSLIPVARPSFGVEEEQAVAEVLRSGWVAQGPRVAELERRFAHTVGAAEAVAVSSGTTALFLSLHALGIGPGDEVVVPSLSFIASTNVVAHCGAAAVFADVEPRTYNLDPAAFSAAITERTRAVIAVHQLGLPADLDRFVEIAHGRGITVLEDAACALGSRYRGHPVGRSPGLACFSFHARKVVVTGEGGMITCDDPNLATRLRQLRNQGMSASALDRHRASGSLVESYPVIGYNFRLSDIHAAIGLVQLDKLDRFLAIRRSIAARYEDALGDMAEVVLPLAPEYAEPNYQSFVVAVRGATRAQRDRVMEKMKRFGVDTRRGLMAAHLESCYRGAAIAGSLTYTEAACAQTIALPMYPDLTEGDQERVINALREALAGVLGV